MKIQEEFSINIELIKSYKHRNQIRNIMNVLYASKLLANLCFPIISILSFEILCNILHLHKNINRIFNIYNKENAG